MFNYQHILFHISYGEIKRFIRDDGIIKVSRRVKELSNKIKNIKIEYEKKYNKEISIEKIASLLKVTKEEVAASVSATSNGLVVSMYENDSQNENLMIIDKLKSERSEVNEITNRIAIEKLIKELSPRDRKIIYLRYFKEQTK